VFGPLVCVGEPTVPARTYRHRVGDPVPVLDEQALPSLRDGLVDIEHHALTPVPHRLRVTFPVQLRWTRPTCTTGQVKRVEPSAERDRVVLPAFELGPRSGAIRVIGARLLAYTGEVTILNGLRG
jgi:hypothetical protein